MPCGEDTDKPYEGEVIMERCLICGKFMSQASLFNAIVRVPYGTCLDTEPSDEEFMHYSCWEKLNPDQQELIKKTSWQFTDRTHSPQGANQ